MSETGSTCGLEASDASPSPPISVSLSRDEEVEPAQHKKLIPLNPLVGVLMLYTKAMNVRWYIHVCTYVAIVRSELTWF